jgi:hypothetical protein
MMMMMIFLLYMSLLNHPRGAKDVDDVCSMHTNATKKLVKAYKK